ncbi:MAG: benzoylsuccinyl-CoA thiolase [Acidimicrobiia bacterium]
MSSPPVATWFGRDAHGAYLVGRHCRSCGSWVFPPVTPFCPNPACGASDLEDRPMSRRGTLWSYTENRYPPPPPYVAGEPFEPYTVAAVELAGERMIVLGQVANGVPTTALRVGLAMEVTIEPLPDGLEVWKWRPAGDD